MNKKNKKIRISALCSLVCAAVLAIGLHSFLAPCGPKEDGSFMTCHWAGAACAGVAVLMLAMSVLHFFAEEKVSIGLDISCGLCSVLSFFLPGNLINLCMMPTMHCRVVMAPGVKVLSVLILAFCIWDLLVCKKAAAKQEKAE